ncbi:MAG: CDP-glycerol glycerophosphotransferase family protein, partial [Halioglobus sp.]|nr:CDP-glycerol glycerophosphotransferase family protein [Halioglobus sp.]
MKIDASRPSHWLLLVLQLAWTLAAIVGRTVSRRGDRNATVLYGHQFCGNLKALYHAWAESPRTGEMYYLSLDPEHARALEAQGINVLRCHRLRDMLVLMRTHTMVTDHGLHLMSPLLRCTDIRFVDVWHGIPFKGFVPGDFKLQHRYDETWVSSPLLKSLYEDRFGFRPEQVLSLGYARTDQLFRRDIDPAQARRDLGLPPDAPVVLFAPTWEQDNKGRNIFPFDSGEAQFLGRLGAACSAHGATLVVRAHQNSRPGDSEIGGVAYCSQRDYPDSEAVLLAADMLICDWSSIAFDFLALERPTLFLDVPAPFSNGFSLGPEYRFGRIVDSL